MMLYHMREKDRVDVLQLDKPDNLPWNLANGLDDKYKQWLANVYGPAYICHMLIHVKPQDSAGWRYNFTAEESLKIRYFWAGRVSLTGISTPLASISCPFLLNHHQGRTCLASSPEYNAITQMAADTAMITFFPRLLLYSEWGSVWAEKTVECLGNYTCLRSLAQSPIEGVSQSCLFR